MVEPAEMTAIWLLVILILKLTSVSAYCPEKCLCLWYTDHTLAINCSGSEQTEVPYGINPQVKVLDLSYNEIKTYNHSKYLKVVEEIDLSNNKITEAYFGGSFQYLERIDLSHNYIERLENVDIENLKHLQRLNLSYNSKLRNVSGLRSDSLEELDLSRCFISYVDEGFLDMMPSIQSIDLSFNSFQTLENIRSDSLETLDVSHGKIGNITKSDIFNLSNLQKLNVSFNPNLKIDFSYETACWDVEEMDLSNSELSSLDEMFPFCSLKVLNASMNKIDVIEVRTFFNNCELVFVNLSNNQISDIASRSFFTTEKLKILDLSVNHIEDIDFSLYLKHVYDLNLSRNQIYTLSSLVLKKVVNLNLSHNKIRDIDINFNENSPKLEKLDLSHNKIRNIKKINSNSLTHVDLSHNKIAYIELKAFENAENLVEIKLAGNKLTTLDFRVIKTLENIKNLELYNNPWTCNCQANEFKELYEFLAVDRPVANMQELKCVKNNDTWRNTCIDSWHREKEWKKTVYSLTVSLAIALIVVAVIFFCKYFNDKKQVETERVCDQIGRRLSSYNDSSHFVNLREPPEIPNRSSTPPPNYEAALLLPKLTEEQRNLAISTLSIASPTPTNEEPADDGENGNETTEQS